MLCYEEEEAEEGVRASCDVVSEECLETVAARLKHVVR